MICRTCYGWRLCLRIGPLHIGVRPVRDLDERWDRLWR
jgi:hypothetical protein